MAIDENEVRREPAPDYREPHVTTKQDSTNWLKWLLIGAAVLLALFLLFSLFGDDDDVAVAPAGDATVVTTTPAEPETVVVNPAPGTTVND